VCHNACFLHQQLEPTGHVSAGMYAQAATFPHVPRIDPACSPDAIASWSLASLGH
jgi:hypothetical protein